MKDILPEEMLENLPEEKMGKLKIFLGYCAGVGKTYHMLDIARAKKEEGKDIVIGYIENHERKDTIELLKGMEILQTKQVKYRSIVLQEVDVEKILERKPEIVVIDEFAHTNVHGSKNEKRYQDIEIILKNGIDVYTTLNIQHIQSLNELVKKVTNIRVKETIPDKYIKKAHTIELIDIEPEELLNRLKQGKIYNIEKIQNALENFFTIENLTKLREISLQYMKELLEQKNIYEDIKEKILIILEKNNIEKVEDKIKNTSWKVIFLDKEISKEQVKWIKDRNGKIENIETTLKNTIVKNIEEKQYSIIAFPKNIFFTKIFIIYYLLRKYEIKIIIF